MAFLINDSIPAPSPGIDSLVGSQHPGLMAQPPEEGNHSHDTGSLPPLHRAPWLRLLHKDLLCKRFSILLPALPSRALENI